MSENERQCPVCAKSFRWGADEDSVLLDNAGGTWYNCRQNAYWKLHFHIQQVHPGHGFYCPQHGNAHGDEAKDFWHVRDGYRACSYCGSMHPDDLFEVIEAGGKIGGTDKNYKIYVDAPSKVDGYKIVGSCNQPIKDYSLLTEALANEYDLSSQDRRAYLGQYVSIDRIGPTVHLKFYYQHMDEAAQDRFIDLYNNQKIKLDHFGLYVAPYFATKVPK